MFVTQSTTRRHSGRWCCRMSCRQARRSTYRSNGGLAGGQKVDNTVALQLDL